MNLKVKDIISRKYPKFKAAVTLIIDFLFFILGEKELVLVYSKGKSGTTTLAESLKKNGLKRVYQFHNLDEKIIKHRIKSFKKINARIPNSLINGLFLKVTLKYFSKYNKISIITMVRDPIDSLVSSYFQNKKNFYKQMIDKKDILKHLENSTISLDEWFERELICHFNVNPFEKFDTKKGFHAIIFEPNNP